MELGVRSLSRNLRKRGRKGRFRRNFSTVNENGDDPVGGLRVAVRRERCGGEFFHEQGVGAERPPRSRLRSGRKERRHWSGTEREGSGTMRRSRAAAWERPCDERTHFHIATRQTSRTFTDPGRLVRGGWLERLVGEAGVGRRV